MKMRRRILFVLVSVLFFTIAIFSDYRFSVCATEAEEELPATVETCKGECRYRPAGEVEEEWSKVEENASYARDTSLKTGERSFIQVTFDSFNSFRMKSNTQVLVGGIEEKAAEEGGGVVKIIRLDLLDGEVGVKLKKLPKDHIMKVAGPTAVAGASGTGFSVLASRAKSLTKVTAFESSVLVEALDKPNKAVEVSEFQEVSASPWKESTITGTGVGYLSTRILGEDFIRNIAEAEDEITISATGTGTPPEGVEDRDNRRETAEEEAVKDALAEMARVVLPMSIDDERKIADLLKDDPEVSKKVYAVIAESDVVDVSFADDDTATATVEISLGDLGEAVGEDIEKTIASVREITRAEYLRQFGVRAYTSTERAATTDAHRTIAERLYGSVIVLGRTLADEAEDDNTVTIKVQGIVRGAKPVLRRYFADGSIRVTLEAPGEDAQQELGRDLVGDTWLTSPETAVVGDLDLMKMLAEPK
jgi:hypothetical protein